MFVTLEGIYKAYIFDLEFTVKINFREVFSLLKHYFLMQNE